MYACSRFQDDSNNNNNNNGTLTEQNGISVFVPNRWANVRKRSFAKGVCVYTWGDKVTGVELLLYVMTDDLYLMRWLCLNV